SLRYDLARIMLPRMGIRRHWGRRPPKGGDEPPTRSCGIMACGLKRLSAFACRDLPPSISCIPGWSRPQPVVGHARRNERQEDVDPPFPSETRGYSPLLTPVTRMMPSGTVMKPLMPDPRPKYRFS